MNDNKMKGLKCGLLLALPIMLGLSLSVCSDTNATEHEIVSIPYLAPQLPPRVNDSSTGKYKFNWSDSSDSDAIGGDGFDISFQNVPDDLVPNGLKFNASLLGSVYENGVYQPSDIFGIILKEENVSLHYKTIYTTSGTNNYYPSFWSNLSQQQNFYTRKPFGQDGKLNFNNSYIGLMSCNSMPDIYYNGNGANCTGLWNTSEYVSSQILPYWYTADGFYTRNSAFTSDGMNYKYAFSFEDMFDKPIKKFSSLRLSLFTYDDYWYNSSVWTKDRQIEFKGAFNFDGDFTLTDEFLQNGSTTLNYTAISATDGKIKYGDFPCTLTKRAVPNIDESGYQYQLEYSCSFNLQDDYLAFYPYVVFNGNGSIVLETDSSWRFAGRVIITDNDTTPGEILGKNLTGGGDGSNIIGSEAWIRKNQGSANEDFFTSLSNLFNFTFINPFAPIFNLFNTGDECVNIPVIASMIHSEESTVCPWFDSTVRNIVTPVLGLSSMMLVFGFAVRWLGSSSGNLFEDSRSEEVSNQGGRWGHFKRGGK